MDRLDALKVFCNVVEAGGFSRAADRLGISTSSVTNQVASLEARFGVKLLHRTTRRMSLTSEGRQCYESALRMLEDMDALEGAMQHSGAVPSGLLRADVPAIVSREIVAPALPGFLERHPDMAVRLTVNDRLVDMVDEGIDVLVRIGALPDAHLVARTLASTSYVCCAAPSYLDKHGVPRSLTDLDGHACLHFVLPKSRRVRPWRFLADGEDLTILPRAAFSTDHVESLLAAALAGAGVIQVLSISVQEQIRTGALVPVLKHLSTRGPDVLALFHEQHLRAAKVTAFVSFLEETFRQRLDDGF